MAGDAAQAIGIGSGTSMSGHTVFIKPNLLCMGQGGFMPQNGSTTKAEVIVGVAEQCLLAGADKVTIGDAAQGITWDWSTVGFFPGNTVFGTTNIQDAVSHLKTNFPSQEIELSCLHEVDEWEYLPSSSNEALMANGLKVGKSFYNADHVISISPLKNHPWADISGTMKNLIGATTAQPPFGFWAGPTWMMRELLHQAYANITSADFDQAGIAAAFIDIIKWRQDNGKQDFGIVECSIGIEGNGTRPLPFGAGKNIDIKARSNIGKYFILASNDLPAIDATNIRIMNQDVNTIRQLVMARNMGLGEITDIDLIGASIDDLLIPNWLKVYTQDEWGLASTVPVALHGAKTQQRSQMVNTMAGLGLPAAMIGGLRAWHHRMQPCCKPKGPCKNAEKKE